MYRQNPGHILNSYILRDWNIIHLTRRYLNDIMLSLFKDTKFSEKVANASSELIENAFKNSPEESDFNIVINQTKNEVVLEIRNYTKDDAKKTFETIKCELDKVYSETDPKEAFKKKILEFVNTKSDHLMLGFAKIRLETGATITASMDNDGLISVKAHFPR